MGHFCERWPAGYFRRVLEQGLRLRWGPSGPPPPLDQGEYSPRSKEEAMAMEKEQKDLIMKKAVEPARRKFCVLKQFCIEKKGSRAMRPILNMKILSPYIDSPHFKMEGVRAMKDLLRKGDWLCRIDLKDAYLHVRLHNQDRRFVQYWFHGHLYQWKVLPFGYRDAPRFFQKLMVTALAPLRKKGVRMVIYLDDILVMEESELRCKNVRDEALRQLVQLGLGINLEKSHLTPTRSLVFLGILVDTQSLMLSLPVEKIAKCRRSIRKILKKAANGNKIALWDLQSLAGTLQATSECMSHQRLRMNHLLETMNEARKLPDAAAFLSQAAKEDLQWWINNMEEWNGKLIVPPQVDHVIEVDASDLGLGAAYFGDRSVPLTAHKFLPPDLHINHRELLAAEYGLRTFSSHEGWKDCSIRIKTDNFVAAAYLNKMGGKVPQLCRITEKIHQFALARNLTISAEWIPGKDNKIADSISRIRNNYADKMLHPRVFKEIQRKFGKMEIDLFATEQTRQVHRYVSRRAEENSWYVDVFSRPLPKGLKMYANPPFVLIGRFLAKVRREKANVTLVAPVWPSQPWWPDLMQMMKGDPLPLRGNPMFLLPETYPQQLIQPPRWEMIACQISGANC